MNAISKFVDAHTFKTLPEHHGRSKSWPTVDSRPPGTPFAPVSLAEVQRILDETNTSVANGGDFSSLNALDNFRQTLSPDRQSDYDQQLENLRNDPRIVIVDPNGNPINDPAIEDMILRGVLSATYPNATLLENTIALPASDDGQFMIVVHPGSVPTGNYYPGQTGSAGGLGTPQGNVAIDGAYFQAALAEGHNLMVHEFSHITQIVDQDFQPSNPNSFPFNQSFPDYFSQSSAVQTEVATPAFDQFLQTWMVDHYYGGIVPLDSQGQPVQLGQGAELYPSLVDMFRLSPQDLATASPTIYQALVDFFGYDPLTQQMSGTLPPVT